FEELADEFGAWHGHPATSTSFELGFEGRPLGKYGRGLGAGAGAGGQLGGGGGHLAALHGHGGGHGFGAEAVEGGRTGGSGAAAATAAEAAATAAAAGRRSGGDLVEVGDEGGVAGRAGGGAGLLVGVVERDGGVVHLGGERIELFEGGGRGGHARIHFDGQRLGHAVAVHRKADGVGTRRRPRRGHAGIGAVGDGGAAGAATAAAAGTGDGIKMHVPPDAVHAGVGRDQHGRGRPIQREAAVRHAGILLTELVVLSGVIGGVGAGGVVGGGVIADDFAGLEDLDLHRAAGGLRQVVVEDGAGERILAGGPLRRPRGGIVGAEADADAGLGLEKKSGAGSGGGGLLAERGDVVEDPEAAAVGAGDQVGAHALGVVLDLDVADGDGGHVLAERVPVVAVIEGNPDLRVGGGVEEAFLAGIFADGVGDRAGGDAAVNLSPGLAAVVGAPEVRVHVVKAEGVGGSVGGQGIEMAGVHIENARPRLDAGGGDVGPGGAAIAGDLDEAVARAGPDDLGVERGGRERGNGAASGGFEAVGVLAGARRDGIVGAAGEVAADAGPAMSVVQGFPDGVGGEQQRMRVGRGLPEEGLGAYAAGVLAAIRLDIGADRSGLAGLAVVERDAGAGGAEDQVGIARIGRGDAVLLDVDRMPVVEGDFAVHRAAGHASRAGVLLPAAEAVGEGVVGGDMVHGGGGLGVPVGPGLATVGADDAT